MLGSRIKVLPVHTGLTELQTRISCHADFTHFLEVTVKNKHLKNENVNIQQSVKNNQK